MGEAKQEEAKTEPKPEEKKEEKKEEKQEEKKEEKKEDKAEEKKEEAKPSPPPPIVLFMDLHCVGCAKKIERSILKCKGVEEVEVDMVQNQVTVKGIVDPQVLCSRIQKKTMRMAKVLSPLPPADGDTTTPEAVAPQESGLATIELNVNMHCEACAQQLRKKILKMKGVQGVEIEQSAKKVTVTGTMNADQLVKYIHRRTGKLAKVIPPPPPPPKEEEKKEEGEKPPEEKKEEKTEEKKEEKTEEKKEEKAAQEQGNADPKKEGEGEGQTPAIPDDDLAKKMAYYYGGGMINYGPGVINEEEMARRMVPWNQWMPVYIVQPPPPRPLPPPQLFSDENPNACCIS